MKPSDMPALDNVGGPYGAPMGRRPFLPEYPDAAIKMYLRPMRIDKQGYDTGGAYWGVGTSSTGRMWIAWGWGATIYVRALNRDHAKQLVREQVPKAQFFR